MREHPGDGVARRVIRGKPRLRPEAASHEPSTRRARRRVSLDSNAGRPIEDGWRTCRYQPTMEQNVHRCSRAPTLTAKSRFLWGRRAFRWGARCHFERTPAGRSTSTSSKFTS